MFNDKLHSLQGVLLLTLKLFALWWEKKILDFVSLDGRFNLILGLKLLNQVPDLWPKEHEW